MWKGYDLYDPFDRYDLYDCSDFYDFFDLIPFSFLTIFAVNYEKAEDQTCCIDHLCNHPR